jgi:2-desacetyl-2-hydroxyethyl bacteriochlorophyllide A dehydrogenase
MDGKMKAAIIESPGELHVRDVPDPSCAPDEVILKVGYSSICNATDVHIWQGTFPAEACPPYPHVLGHECSGSIVEIGKEVDGWSLGDRVSFWVKMSGAFGEYNAVKINKLASVKLSDTFDEKAAPVMEVVGGTLRCMYNNGMQIGDVVVVFGQGPTGLLLMQEAKLFGAAVVGAVDVFDFRLRKSSELGADFVFNLLGKDQQTAFEEMRKTLGQVDFVIDAMGNHRWKKGNAIDLGLSLLRRGGIYQVFGHPTEDQPVNIRRLSNENYTMRGFEPGFDISRRLIRFGEGLVASGRLKVNEMITHSLPLTDLERGLKLCRDSHQETIKVVVKVGS